MKPPKIELGIFSRLILDAVSLPFSLIPGLVAWSSLYFSFKSYDNVLVGLTILLLLPFIFSACVFLLRVLLPRLKEGRYRSSFHPVFISWILHLSLSRAAKISGLFYLIHSFHLYRFFYWRAMGCRCSFSVSSSMDVTLVDLPLIQIGRGSTLGEKVHIACHFFLESSLILRSVKIGENVFLGMRSTVGPGTEIGNNSWIGFGNALAGETLPPGTKRPSRQESFDGRDE